jgi:hypothetical protein
VSVSMAMEKISGRRAALSQLGLAGKEVSISGNIAGVGRKTIVGKINSKGQIETKDPGGGLPVPRTVAKFAAPFGYSGDVAWDKILVTLDSDRTVPLTELRNNHVNVAKAGAELLQKHVLEPLGVTSFKDAQELNAALLREMLSHLSDLHVFRVLREDDDKGGAEAREEGAPLTAGAPVGSEAEQEKSALDHFKCMNDHVRNGSLPSRTRRPFISATEQLSKALWWSFYGLTNRIAKIDLDTALKLGDNAGLAWFVGGAHHELMFPGPHQSYANASAEVVFAQDIPNSAYHVMDIAWEAKQLWLSSADLEKQHKFPAKKQMKMSFSSDGCKPDHENW